MLLKGKSTKALPVPLAFIEGKPCLKLLGVTFQSDPCNWDLYLDNILSKASSRLYILRVNFVNFMDYRWIISFFIFFSLVLFYLFLHMLWKYGAAHINISTV